MNKTKVNNSFLFSILLIYLYYRYSQFETSELIAEGSDTFLKINEEKTNIFQNYYKIQVLQNHQIKNYYKTQVLQNTK